MNAKKVRLLVLRILVVVVAVGLWHLGTTLPIGVSDTDPTKPEYVLPPFFFSTPLDVGQRVVEMFYTGTAKVLGCSEPIRVTGLFKVADRCFGGTIWQHLTITLVEGVLAFAAGSVLGVLFGFWFARQPLLGEVFDPYIKMVNAIPRIVLAPIFMLWLGLGIWSKVALGVTLVFFVVFFNVYQGVREVNRTVLDNARMLGMSERQLFQNVYWPSALTWMFSSLHTAVGFAVLAAVIGEYLGSSAGLGYLIQQAEGTFDVTGVFAGMVILTVFVLVIDAFVTRAERYLLVWRPQPASR